MGRLIHKIPLNDFRAGGITQLQSFDNVQASEFAATQVVPTAVNLSDARAAVALHPSKSRFVTSPRIGYASRLNRAIDGAGTFTLPDFQPCRLLTLLFRHYPASTLQ